MQTILILFALIFKDKFMKQQEAKKQWIWLLASNKRKWAWWHRWRDVFPPWDCDSQGRVTGLTSRLDSDGQPWPREERRREEKFQAAAVQVGPSLPTQPVPRALNHQGRARTATSRRELWDMLLLRLQLCNQGFLSKHWGSGQSSLASLINRRLCLVCSV